MYEESSFSEYTAITLPRPDCVYTSCYCEENVWKLCEYIKAQELCPLDQVHVIFVSNENKTIPIWKQKSSRGSEPVIWDYHVVLLHTNPQSQSFVYDLDTTLPFPCSVDVYLREAFQSDDLLKPEFQRKLRFIPAATYLKKFASDRSHMKHSNGTWRKPPPPYHCIETTESQMNLDDFICMDPSVDLGKVYKLSEFVRHFGTK